MACYCKQRNRISPENLGYNFKKRIKQFIGSTIIL